MLFGNDSLAARVAVPVGVFYVVIGLIGLMVTGFDNFTQNTDDELLGFSINPAHNGVHLLVGSFLLIMTMFTAPVTEGAVIGAGLFYIVAFVLGFVDLFPVHVGDRVDNLTLISMVGSDDLENFNHIVFGVILLLSGLASSAATSARSRRTGGTA